ncbi:autotransporter family protein [Desulfotalea psychrophila]|uniref:Autotransporter domain-containing protein n=1 Tax=Desulfotalea psychrophila (strain LSv54 / DSM 12343) TaxID=177439 RepID=Q6AKC7_DESPS|nr:autotransporter outer membrane beta-barrel domain-containing protein [Desulfotalea psychrophila]CAG37198.1 hypothetical protein DP2469 [Desulfotalea psychrophila LSv54]
MKDVERRGRRKVYATKSALAGLLALSMGATNAWAGVTIGEGGAGRWDEPFYYALATAPATTRTAITHGKPGAPNIKKMAGSEPFLTGIRVESGSLDNEGEIRLYFRNEKGSISLIGIIGDTSRNGADVELGAEGGTATSATVKAKSFAYTYACGIQGEVGDNEGKINITAQSGTAEANAAKAKTSAYAHAHAHAYGIRGRVGDNIGHIELKALGGKATAKTTGTAYANASAYAYGIVSNVTNNSGEMELRAQGGTTNATALAKASAYAHARAHGIMHGVGSNEGKMTITAQGGEAEATAAETNGRVGATAGAIGISGTVGNNEGKMTIRATGGKTNGHGYSSSYAYAAGINGKVGDNIGHMEIRAEGGTATAKATGTADALAYALSSAHGIKGNVANNNGEMEIRAEGGKATAKTTANATTLALANTNATAYGIEGQVGSNKGKMTIIAQSGKAEATAAKAEAYAYAHACGIKGGVGSSSGNITVRATGGSAIATSTATAIANAKAYGMQSSVADLVNTGAIEVVARAGRYSTDGGTTYHSDSATAYGVYFNGLEESSLDSRALISVSALPAQDEAGKAIALGTDKTLQAHQVYSGGDLTIKGYAMKFNNQEQVTADYKGTIGVADGKRVTFAPDAQVYAFIDNDFGTVPNYSIPMLVEGETRNYNQFSVAQLVVSSPDYSISLLDGNGGTLQQLAIAYVPKVSTPLVTAQVNQKMLTSGTTIVEKSSLSPMLAMMERSNPRASAYDGVLLASTSPILTVPDMEILPQKRGWAFAMPYYSNVSNNASPMGYDADIYGATAGYNHWIDSDLILGFHAGYGSGDINYTGKGYEQKKENLKAGSLGVQSLYRFADDWLLQSIASFYYSSNDYSDNNPLNREQGDYHGYGVNAKLDLDYVFSFINNRLIPSVGLRYLWQHVDSYTAYNLDNADVNYGDMDENQLYASLGLDWYGDYQTESNWQIVPSLGLGIEQALTDNEFGNSMGVGSVIIPVTNSMDKTSVSARASIEFVKDSYALSAGYAGAYSSDTKNSSFYLQMKYFF